MWRRAVPLCFAEPSLCVCHASPDSLGWVSGLLCYGPLQGPRVGTCLLEGSPVEVLDIAGVGSAVVRTVDRAVDCVAAVMEEAVGCVVAWVTVGPVAVVLAVAVGAGADVARVVIAEVVLGDTAGNSVRNIPCDPSCRAPLPWCSSTLGPYLPRSVLALSGWWGLSLCVWRRGLWLWLWPLVWMGGWRSGWEPQVCLGSLTRV